MEEAGMISATRYANKEVCGGAVAALVRYLLHTYDLTLLMIASKHKLFHTIVVTQV